MKKIFLLFTLGFTTFGLNLLAQNTLKSDFTTGGTEVEPSFQVKKIQIDKYLHLEYIERGNDHDLPVIFLHGITDSWHSYENIIPLLPKNIHSFAITQRGHGNSDKPERGYHPVDFANDVARFIKARGLGKAIIVGHSMGAIIAQEFVIKYPDLTKGIVLVGGAPTFNDNPVVSDFITEVSKLSDPIDPAFARDFQLATLSKEISKVWLDTLVKESLKLPARVWISAFNGLKGFDFRPELSKIKQPVLIIWGEKDSFISRNDQDILFTNIPDSKLLIYKNTGHAVHWEQPEKFASDLVEYLKQFMN